MSEAKMVDKLGVCQWFHFEDYAAVNNAVAWLEELGVKRLRTGVFWADWHRPGAGDWYDWMLRSLSLAGLEVLVSFWCTPPSLADLNNRTSQSRATVWQLSRRPPREEVVLFYQNDLRNVLDRCGQYFNEVELWNEPNNCLKWDFSFDPNWNRFARMVVPAARAAREFDKVVCLGGMSPCDPNWVLNMREQGVLDEVEVVGIHDFPGMWTDLENPHWATSYEWPGWKFRVESVHQVTKYHPVWVTETGFSTTRGVTAELEQVRWLLEAARAAEAERVYWYSLVDLDPSRKAVEGFHVDEDEYHMGLVTSDGRKKLAFAALKDLLS